MNRLIVSVLRSRANVGPFAQTSWEKIIEAVARHSGLSSSELLGRSRGRKATMARGAVCYLARRLTEMTLEEIGKELGGRDHTTILYILNKTQTTVDEEGTLRTLIDRCLETLEVPPSVSWRVEIVDPNPGSPEIADRPGLRVIYQRPDGTEWVAVLGMQLR